MVFCKPGVGFEELKRGGREYQRFCFCRKEAAMKSQPDGNHLTEREENLLRLIRKIEYGEIKIIVQDKQPVRVEETKKSIKL